MTGISLLGRIQCPLKSTPLSPDLPQCSTMKPCFLNTVTDNFSYARPIARLEVITVFYFVFE